MIDLKFRYIIRNKHTGLLHKRYQYLSEIELGLHKLFDVENYDIISRDYYTGRKDKNGKDVYDKDIVKQFGNRRPMKVEWYRLAFRFDRVFHMCETQDEAIEVIGNIHENPELIEK